MWVYVIILLNGGVADHHLSEMTFSTEELCEITLERKLEQFPAGDVRGECFILSMQPDKEFTSEEAYQGLTAQDMVRRALAPKSL